MCQAEVFDTWSLESTKSGHRVRAFGDCRMDWRAKSYIGAQGIDLAELTDEEAVALIESERRRQMIRNAIGPPNGR